MSPTATIEPSSGIAAVEELRAKLTRLAGRLSQLSSIAQMLSRMAGSRAGKPDKLMAPFEQARQSVLQFLQHLEAGEVDAAERLLTELTESFLQLENLVGDADDRISPTRLSRYLNDNDRLSPDVLARLLEFYAAEQRRNEASRKKMLSVALTLVIREHTAEADPKSIKNALDRRRVTLPLHFPSLPRQLAEQSHSLRAQIAALETQSSADLVPLYTQLEEFRTALGDYLYCEPGLSEALASALALFHKQHSIEAPQIQAFFDLADELDDDEPDEMDEQELLELLTLDL